MRLVPRFLVALPVAVFMAFAIGGVVASASDYLDVSGMKAIYDAETGNIRFEGLFNIHGLGIGRNENVEFRPEGATTTQASFSIANQEEIGWLFLGGIEGGSFDAGAIFPKGLSEGLSDFYIGVASMGSGKSITPIPIYTPSGIYLPNFDLYATPAPPVEEVPPVLEPVTPGIPVEPVIPNEPIAPPAAELPPAVAPPASAGDNPPNWPEWSGDQPVVDPDIFDPPVVTVEEPAPPIDSAPIIFVIDDGITTWDPVLGEQMTFQPTWDLTLPYLGLGGRVLPYGDLVDVSLNGLVDFADLNADSLEFASLSLNHSAAPLVFHQIGASLSGTSALEVAVPEPCACVVLLGAGAGFGAVQRHQRRRI